MFDPYAGTRITSFRWDVLTLDDKYAGTLDAEGGSVDWNVYRDIRTTGSLEWKGRKVPDWLTMRVQPWIVLEFPASGFQTEWPLGVFIPSTPDTEWSSMFGTESVDLYDKLQVLVDAQIDNTYALAPGTVVTDAVRTVLSDSGETRMTITPSSETLRNPMVWEPGTTRLRIINDLLSAINYFSLWVDGYGVYQAQPFIAADSRGTARTFTEGASRLFTPNINHSRDTFKVPNVVNLATSPPEGDGPVLTSTFRNDNPDDPLSTVRRRREISVTETGIEATSQAVLDAMAARRFADLTQVASTVTIKHAPVPLDLNDVVSVQDDNSGINLSGVVQAMTYQLKYDALMESRVREVVRTS